MYYKPNYPRETGMEDLVFLRPPIQGKVTQVKTKSKRKLHRRSKKSLRQQAKIQPRKSDGKFAKVGVLGTIKDIIIPVHQQNFFARLFTVMTGNFKPSHSRRV